MTCIRCGEAAGWFHTDQWGDTDRFCDVHVPNDGTARNAFED